MFFQVAVVYVFRDWFKLKNELHVPPPNVIVPPPPSVFGTQLRDGDGRVVRFLP